MSAFLLLFSATVEPFSAGGLRQGMTRAEVAAVGGEPVATDTDDVTVTADDRRYLVTFCGDRLHQLRAPYANDVEWLAALEWLQSRGFRLRLPTLSASGDAREERRELRQPLAHPTASYRVTGRMISRSSPAGMRTGYQLDFVSTASCRGR